MNWAHPWLLLMLLPLGFAAWRLLRRGRRSGIRFSAISRLPAKAAGWRAKVAAFSPYLLLLGLVMLVLASARPRTPLAHARKTVDALAIAMAVDVSGSMIETDLAPKGKGDSPDWTRLAVVKRVFADFVAKRPDDLIGLITFGGYASTRSPLTADHEALLHVLRGVEIPEVQYDAMGRPIDPEEVNTAIGDGLATALARLKSSQPKSKIVILLSDGVSNTGVVEPEAATQAAVRLGVKVYAIGIGTQPKLKGYDMFGRAVTTRPMDEAQLKRIASTTGGMYFPVNDKDSLEKALDDIDKLETTPLEADAYDRWEEHFVLLLLAGVILVLLAVSLSMSSARRPA